MPASPRILVCGSLNSAQAGQSLNTALNDLAQSAFDRLKQAEMAFDFIEASESPALPWNWANQYQGLLVLGGADMDPALYGEDPHDTVYGVNRQADEFELDILQTAIGACLPMLGICRGMQLINVALGGKLIQHLGDGSIHSSTANNSIMNTHDIELATDQALHRVYRQSQIAIRSGHHQAVGQLGQNLAPAATAPDGVIEAICSTNHTRLIGVQWHPEERQADARHFAALIQHAFMADQP